MPSPRVQSPLGGAAGGPGGGLGLGLCALLGIAFNAATTQVGQVYRQTWGLARPDPPTACPHTLQVLPFWRWASAWTTYSCWHRLPWKAPPGTLSGEASSSCL